MRRRFTVMGPINPSTAEGGSSIAPAPLSLVKGTHEPNNLPWRPKGYLKIIGKENSTICETHDEPRVNTHYCISHTNTLPHLKCLKPGIRCRTLPSGLGPSQALLGLLSERFSARYSLAASKAIHLAESIESRSGNGTPGNCFKKTEQSKTKQKHDGGQYGGRVEGLSFGPQIALTL